MHGDGMDAMELALEVASWGMIALPALLGGWLGRRFLSRRVGSTLGIVLGTSAGCVWVLFTFFENISSPPPQLTIDVPPSFAHDTVILITDSTSQSEVTWSSAGHWPFKWQEGRISVPLNGVLRLRSLGPLGGQSVAVRLSDGREDSGFTLDNFPGGRVAAYDFAQFGESRDGETPSPGTDAFATFVRKREAEH